MSYIEISHLELQLDKLIGAYHKLCAENQLLRAQLQETQQSQMVLVEKNQKAVIKIKSVISQLREESNERTM